MPTADQEMRDKVALVTGGNSGIGRAAVLAFAKKGASVVFAARRAKEAEETLALAHALGTEVRFIRADVTVSSQVENLFRETLKNFGRLDYAFNNAGTENGIGPLWKLTEKDWDECMSVNLKGAWLCLKHEVEAMLKTGGGAIVNNASISGVCGISGGTIYGASKSGIIGMTKAAAIEYAKTGIRVNAIAPGAVDTPMAERLFGSREAVERFAAQAHPMGRLIQPEEVAETVIWLCSDQASSITGQILPIDGGYTAQ